MSMSIQQFSHFVSELNEQMQTLNASELADWAVSDLADKLNFDSAWFGWADLSDACPKIEASGTLHLPDTFYQYWQQMATDDVLVKQVLEDGVSVASYDRQGKLQTDGMADLSDHFDLAKILTVTPEAKDISRLFFLSAYRAKSNSGQWISADEEYLQCAVDQLGKALRTSQIKQGRRADGVQLDVVVSASGMVLLGLDAFTRNLGYLFEHWQGPYLPQPLLHCALYPGQHILMEQQLIVTSRPAQPKDNLPLVNLFIRTMTLVDRLSKRELQVSEALVQGLSHKEVAKNLGISPATVRNQIQAIYQKLDIDNRACLSQLLTNYHLSLRS